MEGNATMKDMDERPLSEQVEAMKDDPDAWGEPVAAPERKARSERRQRGAVVSVRLSADEIELLQAYADQEGLALSAVLRERTLEAARRASEAGVEPPTVAYLQPRRGRSATFTYTGQISQDMVVVSEA